MEVNIYFDVKQYSEIYREYIPIQPQMVWSQISDIEHMSDDELNDAISGALRHIGDSIFTSVKKLQEKK